MVRKIYKIAIRELNTLFYSPVAWLILIIFIFQASMYFTQILDIMLQQQFSRPLWYSIASGVFTGHTGILYGLQNNLYLYIPLLTMGLLSKEYSSGTIKLLYSSPVNSLQIVLGKFLAMMIYGLLMVGIIVLFICFLLWRVPQLDVGLAFSGILAIYLIICVYTSIGLFMSSLTSYQIVAAIATLAVLTFLNKVTMIAQGVNFLRDITYWLSIHGRSEEIISGIISSEDVLYFILITILFLAFSVIRLQSGKEKISRPRLAIRYASVTLVVIFLGYLSSRPAFKFYYDATATKTNTLTDASKEIIGQLDGGLTITTYVNLLESNRHEGLPENINSDKKKFEKYLRFKPEIKMKYVYYYAEPEGKGIDRKSDEDVHEKAARIAENLGLNIKRFMSPEQLAEKIDLTPEGFRFVRLLERESGEKAFLRIYDDSQKFPREYEITTALKRLTTKAPVVGFLSGHGERNIDRAGDRDYYTFARSVSFRHSLINIGFEVRTVFPEREGEISEEIDILVISDINEDLSEEEITILQDYIQRGGNLLVLCEPENRVAMQPVLNMLGLGTVPGVLVRPVGDYRDDLLVAEFTPEISEAVPEFRGLHRNRYGVTMPGSMGLTCDTLSGFNYIPVLKTPSEGCWNELTTRNFADDKATYDPDLGEIEKAYVPMYALQKEETDREQRIFVLGDADCISNAELLMSRPGIRNANYNMIVSMFRWLSYGEFPIDTPRPPVKDKLLKLTMDQLPLVKLFFIWGIPALLLLGGAWCLIRRRRK